jgi:inosose dehydratase
VLVRVANAPVSFGVFGEYAQATSVQPAQLLADLARNGYTGIDLGPPDWLGTRSTLRSNLDDVGLDLAGGWVDLPFADTPAYRKRLPELDLALDLFVAGSGDDPAWWPKPTIAVTGRPERELHPCAWATRHDLGRDVSLDDDAWRALAANLGDAMLRCRDRGLEPTFHHHVSTDVESVAEIERLLDLTDIGLTLDTGHLLMGGGDPVTALRTWADRVNHVHLKDVLLDKALTAAREGADQDEVWRRNHFCALGDGDLDLDGTLRVLDEIGYAGWLVVEQDVVPGEATGYDAILDDQVRSRRVLSVAGVVGPADG